MAEGREYMGNHHTFPLLLLYPKVALKKTLCGMHIIKIM